MPTNTCEKEENPVKAFLQVEKKVISLPSTAGTEQLVTKTTCTWRLTEPPDWLTPQPSSGKGYATVEIIYATNATNANRSITFDIETSEPSFVPFKIKVNQAK